MKKLLYLLSIVLVAHAHQPKLSMLLHDQYQDIVAQYNCRMPEVFNQLQPEERIFVYYLYRAALPGHRIFAMQTHRHALAIMDLCQHILDAEPMLMERTDWHFDMEQFMNDVKMYLLHLWVNHGHYSMPLKKNNKITPAMLGLTYFNITNLAVVIAHLQLDKVMHNLKELAASIFNPAVEPSMCVAGSIEESATNLYSPNFKTRDYMGLPEEQRCKLNACYDVMVDKENNRVPSVHCYRVGDICSEELDVCVYWLSKAYEHALGYPNSFDPASMHGLEHLIAYLQTGDEQEFKEHSKHWLATKSRVDYVFGFIEPWQDPMGHVGAFQAEINVKSLDTRTLAQLLMGMESKLPFPEYCKRSNPGNYPNISICTPIFGTGLLGPLQMMISYCLPNYADICKTLGHRHMVYDLYDNLGEIFNPTMYKKLFHCADHLALTDRMDPEGELQREVRCIYQFLRKTIGQESNVFTKHVFMANDYMHVDDKEYHPGNRIKVTEQNYSQIMQEYADVIEELRTHLIALHSFMDHVRLLKLGKIIKKLPPAVKPEQYKEMILSCVISQALKDVALTADDDGLTSLTQAHLTLLNYLVEFGALEVVEEQVVIDGQEFTAVGIKILDLQKAIDSIKDLMVQVQEMKSSADYANAKKLVDHYGHICNPNHSTILRKNMATILGSARSLVHIYPLLTPIVNDQGTMVDVDAFWPENIIQEWMIYKDLMMSKE